MARKTYTGTFNLNTLQPAMELADPNAVLFLRDGSFEVATGIEVDAKDLTPIDAVVAAHNPATKSTKQNDFDSLVSKLQGLGFTDDEIKALGVNITRRSFQSVRP